MTWHPSLSRRGSTAVEFGLLLPVLTALLCGFLEFGWVFYQNGEVARVVRGACREAAVDAQAADPALRAQETIRRQLVAAGVPCQGKDCIVSAELLGDARDATLSCRVSVPLRPLTNVAPLEYWTVRTGTSMRMEWGGTR